MDGWVPLSQILMGSKNTDQQVTRGEESVYLPHSPGANEKNEGALFILQGGVLGSLVYFTYLEP